MNTKILRNHNHPNISVYYIRFLTSTIILIAFLGNSSFSQKTHYCKEYKKLSRPEKWWVIFHPFIAKKAFRLTQIARKAADSIKKTNTLDADADGGQVDAFRHSYWMALLSSKINKHKTFRLGIAHEKGNYLAFKHSQYEENSIPDKIASDMDLCNNMSGIEISLKFKVQSLKFKQLQDSLKKVIIDSILKGKMTTIKKDKSGHSLDDKGNIIPADSLKNKWKTNRILVPSNFSRP